MPQKKTAAELAELADAAHERVVTWCLRNGTTLYPADRHRGRVRYAHRIHDNRLTGGDKEQ